MHFERAAGKHPIDTSKLADQFMRNSRTNDTPSDDGSDSADNNVFPDLGFDNSEAVNLHIRGLLAIEICRVIRSNGWSQRKAATIMGIPQPRVAEVMRMKLHHYTIDLLLKYLDKLGRKITIVIGPKDEVA